MSISRLMRARRELAAPPESAISSKRVTRVGKLVSMI